MSVRKVEVDLSGEIQVQPCHEDLEKLKISEYHRFYLGLEAGTNGVYKLHQVFHPGNPSDEVMFIWIAMWNSIVYTSINGVNNWSSIEKALKYAINHKWIVIQGNNYEDFSYLTRGLKGE